VEGVTPITVRCGSCGAVVGITEPDPSGDGEVFTTPRHPAPRPRRASSRTRAPLPLNLMLPVAGVNAAAFRGWARPVPCPSARCSSRYALDEIVRRINEARRRGVTSIKIHRTSDTNV